MTSLQPMLRAREWGKLSLTSLNLGMFLLGVGASAVEAQGNTPVQTSRTFSSSRSAVPSAVPSGVGQPAGVMLQEVSPQVMCRILEDLNQQVAQFRAQLRPYLKMSDLEVGWDRSYRTNVFSHLRQMEGYASVIVEVVSKPGPGRAQARREILTRYFPAATNVSPMQLYQNSAWGAAASELTDIAPMIRLSIAKFAEARSIEREIQRESGWPSADKEPRRYPRIAPASDADGDAAFLQEFLAEPIRKFKWLTVQKGNSDNDRPGF